jgi:hypothetical protein
MTRSLSTMRINVITLVIAFLLSISTVRGETVYPVRAFEEGQFPKVGNVFGLMQDQQGILWIWGSQGISIYDGNRFSHYSTDQGLPSNYVYNIRQRDDGTLAICTYGGMAYYQPGSFRFTPVTDPAIGPIRDVMFHPLGILLATDHGVILQRNGLYYLLPNLKQDEDGNHTLMVHRLAWDPVLNQVWAATDRWGLLRLNMDDLSPLLDLDPAYERPDSIIYEPLLYGNEVPSFSEPGHYRLADSTKRLELWHRVSALLSSPASGMKSWIPSGWATYGVLFDQRRARTIVWDNFNAYTVSHNTITRVVKFPTNVSLNSVVLSEDGRLSFARNDGLYFLEDDDSLHRLSAANGLPSNVVLTHLVDHEGHLWFVNYHNNLYRMTTTAINLYSARNYPILQDMRQTQITDDGEILAASAHGIVSVSNGVLKTIVRFDHLESDFINFAVDKKSNLLIGTTTRLYLFERETGRLRPITAAGAPHVGRMDIARDGEGNLRFAYQELLRKWDGEKLSTMRVRETACTSASGCA